MRAELLHRVVSMSVDGLADSVSEPGVVPFEAVAGGVHVVEDRDIELARLDPRWVRFAPFTMSGVLAAAAIFGVGWNLLDQLNVTPSDVGPVRGFVDHMEQTAIWLLALQVVVTLAALVTALSIGGYLLSYWGFRLTRHAQGSLHITRGLLTTRATSIEERRLRGVELGEPLLLRAVHAARLSGITTGLESRGRADGGSSLLLPPAPLAAAKAVASQILGDPTPVEISLTPPRPGRAASSLRASPDAGGHPGACSRRARLVGGSALAGARGRADHPVGGSARGGSLPIPGAFAVRRRPCHAAGVARSAS